MEFDAHKKLQKFETSAVLGQRYLARKGSGTSNILRRS